MNSKSVRSAVIIQPPLDQWPQIQEFREQHDKAFIRWMPHINLLYPFFQANKDVVSQITKAVAKISPFKISLEKFSFFEHSAKSCTLYLDPHPIDDLVKLQQTLEAVFPDCNDLSTRGNGKFSPHLTLGQFNGPVPTKQKMLELSKSWKDCSFVVDSIHIIARDDSDPFSVVHTIPLGPTKEENNNTPTKKKQIRVDKAAEEAASFAEMKSFVLHAKNKKAIVMLDVQQIKREGAPPNLRNLLFNRDNFPEVLIITISPTKSDTIVRCNTCERMVGKWKFETDTDSLVVCGDFETLTTQFRDANITYNPIFTLPHSISQFSSHLNLPSDSSSHDEFTIPLSSNVTPPSVDDEVREISQRVKRWMKKMNGNLPTSKSKFHNATRSLRIFKGFVDSGAVLQRILAENKIKFCTPCKNYSIMPEAYQSKSAKVQDNDEVGKIAVKTVDWLCKQRRVPPNVKSLRTQIDTFGFTKEVDAEKVWQVLLEEGVVSSDNPVTYNLDAIRVDERPPRNPLFPDIELPTPQKQQQQQQQQHKTQNYGDEDYGNYEDEEDAGDEDENERDDDEYNDDEYNDDRNGRRQNQNENFENFHSAFEKRAQAAISNFDKIIAIASKSSKPRPFESFDDMSVKEDLLRGIYQFGLEKPSLIQKQSLPAMFNGKDVVVQSQGGTGKTIAYVIAVLHKIKQEKTTQSIVMVPTRELAVYVSKILIEIGDYMNVTAHVVVGGASVSGDVRALQKGPQVVVGTCGRIADMIKRNCLQTKNIQMIVLDEADELLSKEKDVIYDIYTTLPAAAQTVLVSSTFTIETHDLWVKFLREPVLFLEKRDKMITGNFQNIKLVAKREEEKEQILQRVLSSYQLSSCESVIVFCNTKRKVDWLCSRGNIPGMKGIHGDMCQSERDIINNEFVIGLFSILVTTGQNSRGINNTSVGGVVMYDFPQTAIEYYHRMARAGRFGRKGICVSLTTPNDEISVKSVEKYFSFKFKVQNNM